ncbi:MAG TPA: alpha/beta hydrolase [Acidimicrobiales bacterium]|nr:alpha/beta hydrolase [Acidimicrobiales bacterium]
MITVDSTDGVRLAVHELGDPGPDARPLLLCHATGFHGRVWRALADELPDRRCIAIDFRGFGDSTEPDRPLEWKGFADDVLAVVDALDLGPVQAVGHSKGGAALLLAEQARPGTISAAVCFEPIVFPPSEGEPGPNPLAEVTRHRREEFASYEEAIERFGAKPPLGSLRPDVLDDYVRFGFAPVDDGLPEGPVRLKARREHEAATYQAAPAHSGFHRLQEVRCPVLVVHGGDGQAPAEIAPLIAAELPAGELLSVPERGHFGPLEDPAWFAGVVRGFLDPR